MSTAALATAAVLLATAAFASSCAGAGRSSERARPLWLGNPPYLGLACHDGGSTCGRIGIAVWLRKPATSVRATLLGKTISLASSRRGSGAYGYRLFWTGFVHTDPASVEPLRRYRLVVRVRRDGTRLQGLRSVLLSAGWG